MAIRDEIREQRQSLKGQDAKAHLSYFWEYYKFPTLAIILVVCFLAYLIYTRVTAKDTVFTAYFVNASDDVYETKETLLMEEFGEVLSIDPKHEEVNIDLSQSQKVGDDTSSEALALSTRLSVAVSNGDLDCAVMNAGNFDTYADMGTFQDLRDVFSEEELAKYEDNIYYFEEYPAGIDVTNAAYILENELYPEEQAIFGFGAGCENYDNAKLLLDFLF